MASRILNLTVAAIVSFTFLLSGETEIKSSQMDLIDGAADCTHNGWRTKTCLPDGGACSDTVQIGDQPAMGQFRNMVVQTNALDSCAAGCQTDTGQEEKPVTPPCTKVLAPPTS